MAKVMIKENIGESGMLSELNWFLGGKGDTRLAFVIDHSCTWAVPGSSAKAIRGLKMLRFILKQDNDQRLYELTNNTIEAIKKWQTTKNLEINYV